MKRIIFGILLVGNICLVSPKALSQIDSSVILEVAANLIADPECLEYCVVGVCISVICTTFGCDIETTAWIRHRAPDLMVSVYQQPGENTWDEATSLFGDISKEAADRIVGLPGIGATGGPNYTHREKSDRNRGADQKQSEEDPITLLHFKEASVIGSPSAELLDDIEGFCPAEVELFRPYFLSEFDAFEWRWGLAELFYGASYITGLREISQTPFTTWGGVHPRTGWVMSEHRGRAAAVAAQRSVDIVTRDDQPHIYYEQSNSTANNGSNTLSENQGPVPADEKGDRWQMIFPQSDSTCSAFGAASEYVFYRNSEADKYAWIYWQRRNCCPYANGVVIAQIPFTPICT